VQSCVRWAMMPRPSLAGTAGISLCPLRRAKAHHLCASGVITDQDRVFTGGAFTELADRWGITQRFAAVGQHGSIAVTEHVIRTLKYECLNRVPVIRGIDHLSGLLDDMTSPSGIPIESRVIGLISWCSYDML